MLNDFQPSWRAYFVEVEDDNIQDLPRQGGCYGILRIE